MSVSKSLIATPSGSGAYAAAEEEEEIFPFVLKLHSYEGRPRMHKPRQ
jgi:hypothetical protein